ncbi:hypothetical protein IH601_06520 [Candidatus Bipolaricaulota bacterium]|nr:hypothetical protein [Candidatus Bipolaricaulota bacterium]TFH07043.1 MAG: hypothetical protein E4H08_10140 [Candidatus Atribacteria bacterium]
MPRLSEITADYISGFADADGCISGYRIDITNTDREILAGMRDWLRARGIQCRIIAGGAPVRRNHKQAYHLRITHYTDLLRFRNIVGFRLHSKREKLDIRLIEGSKPGKLYCIEEHDLAFHMLHDGASQERFLCNCL